MKLGDRYCRVLFLKDYVSYIKDDFVTVLTDLTRSMMLSIDILSVPTDEAVREVENRLLGVETNITNWQRRQNQNNNFSTIVPYDMELQRKESKEFLDDLTTRDQRMMEAVLTLVITADTKQELDADTDRIRQFTGQRIIDRCTAAVYEDAERSGMVPTLATLREKLLEQPEDEAREIALALELFTTGSLDIFGHKSTVDLDKRVVVVFDIHGLGEQLKPIGHLVITDTMLNRVTLNWKKGKRTHVFLTSSTSCLRTSFPPPFSTPRGGSSESATPIPPPSRRMWSICWTPFRPAPCSPTPSSLSCSIRRQATKSWRGF